MGRHNMEKLCVVALLIACALGSSHGAPMESIDGLKHLAMDANVAEMGESDMEAQGFPLVGEGDDENFDGESTSPQQSTGASKTSCEDVESPTLCLHKSILCDDPTHSLWVRTKCPLTCGICAEVGDSESDCADSTSACEGYKSKCNLK